MKLYHATTQKKAKQYRQSGAILAPVRGFTTMQAAMAWAMKVGRVVILEFEATIRTNCQTITTHLARLGGTTET
jgi:hypothetical protein